MFIYLVSYLFTGSYFCSWVEHSFYCFPGLASESQHKGSCTPFLTSFVGDWERSCTVILHSRWYSLLSYVHYWKRERERGRGHWVDFPDFGNCCDFSLVFWCCHRLRCGEGNAISRVYWSISALFCNKPTFECDFCMCVANGHSSLGIRSEISAEMCVLHKYVLQCSMNIDWWP